MDENFVYGQNSFWDIFENIICKIPHGSGNTSAISEKCAELAKSKGYKFIKDSSNNLIVYIPGSKGREYQEPLILQNHLDMVCAKKDGTSADMENSTIKTVFEDGFLHAEDTTLGADNGIGVAYMLAIMLSDDISHPPLELLFTADEEIGMVGATALDTSPIKSKRLINIDSESEGVFTVSCAGGVRAVYSIPISVIAACGTAYKLKVSGLKGGHSGGEIHLGRINANCFLCKILMSIKRQLPIGIVSINGGEKHNTIPSFAEAVITVEDKHLAQYNTVIKDIINSFCNEIYDKEPDVSVLSTALHGTDFKIFDDATAETVLSAFYESPNGVIEMSPNIPRLVETSLNLSVVKTAEDSISFNFFIRSNNSCGKSDTLNMLKKLKTRYGGNIELFSDYPSWEYRKESPLRDKMCEVYKDLFGKAPLVTAIHAGLECGILSGKIKDLDAVSFGPNIFGAHTPKETVSISSANRCWIYLKTLLEQI